MLSARPSNTAVQDSEDSAPVKLIRLWTHECLRVFGDRLSDPKDHATLLRVCREACLQHYHVSLDTAFQASDAAPRRGGTNFSETVRNEDQPQGSGQVAAGPSVEAEAAAQREVLDDAWIMQVVFTDIGPKAVPTLVATANMSTGEEVGGNEDEAWADSTDRPGSAESESAAEAMTPAIVDEDEPETTNFVGPSPSETAAGFVGRSPGIYDEVIDRSGLESVVEDGLKALIATKRGNGQGCFIFNRALHHILHLCRVLRTSHSCPGASSHGHMLLHGEAGTGRSTNVEIAGRILSIPVLSPEKVDTLGPLVPTVPFAPCP